MWLATYVFVYRTLSGYLVPTLNTLEIVLLVKAAKSKLAVLSVKTTKLKMTYFCVNKMICLTSK